MNNYWMFAKLTWAMLVAAVRATAIAHDFALTWVAKRNNDAICPECGHADNSEPRRGRCECNSCGVSWAVD